jgi:histidine ammonia-lyase
MGEGKMWDTESHTWNSADKVLERAGLTRLSLQAKEGLALINGTQFICALAAEALARATLLALQADVVAALTLECLRGSVKAFDARIHAARPHSGQMAVAKRFRTLLIDPTSGPSEISHSHHNCNRVQDSYTLRCIPQVHGVVHDTIAFVRSIISTELNSATDNPMIFADPSLDSDIEGFNGNVVSGGNFHGEYPAKAADYLAIGINEIANISERRIERLVNSSLSGLPPFLVTHGGLNSGFMIAHCTAAALTSENKVLVHPSSSDTISTSAAKEDHVSMGGFGARKLLQVVENVEKVVAIELLAACQGLEFLRPLHTTPTLEKVFDLVRSKVAPYDKDRYMAPDIEAVHQLLKDGLVWDCAKHLFEGNNAN